MGIARSFAQTPLGVSLGVCAPSFSLASTPRKHFILTTLVNSVKAKFK